LSERVLPLVVSIYSTDFPQLTLLQRETLSMLAQGMSNAEIARLHFVSEKSVEQMVGRIARTFDISPQASSNMRVLLTLSFLTGLDEVVA
jgi:two-component system, NarL family, response regulator DegU